MSDAVIFAIVFVGFFILRLIAATVFFFVLLGEGHECPHCNAETLRVESPLQRVLPWLRSSWCPDCGWEGVLRSRRAPAPPAAAGQDAGVTRR